MNLSGTSDIHELDFSVLHAPLKVPRTKPLILAIDDDPDNLLVLIHVLKRLNYDFITAMDGQSGLELAIEHQPDLILLDIMLPMLDGYEFVRRMKLIPEIASIPTVAVTALAGLEDLEKISLTGFVDQITKPYFIEELRVKIARWLSVCTGFLNSGCEGLV
jgi:two-component system, cell cycle response regulator DivK